jgi:hypothetical protein
MRELNIGTKKHTTVICIDEPGQGGACHKYEVYSTGFYDTIARFNDVDSDIKTVVNFQNGPVKENGVNGCHNEDLIAIVIDRLQGFQSGEFKCRENAIAITKLEEALLWLRKRTMDREARGVEGTNIK